MPRKLTHGGKRTGAGRKPAHPEGRTVLVTASVPGGLMEGLDALATKQGWNRSEAITEAIRGLLGIKSGELGLRSHP
jgi:Ribbon-helix-helix protein, copG family